MVIKTFSGDLSRRIYNFRGLVSTIQSCRKFSGIERTRKCSQNGIYTQSQYKALHSGVNYKATATASSHKPEEESHKQTTVSPGEVEKFEKMASSWWNPNGEMKELHSMNKLRVPLITKGLLTGKNNMNDLLSSPTPINGFSLLDIGCGGGILTEPLGRLGASVIGIDPGKENIAVAEMHLSPELNDKVSYLCTTVEEFSKQNDGKTYDGVVMSEIIEHVENPEVFLEIVTHLVKPGGSLFITTLNRTFESWAGAVVAWEYLLRKLPVGTHSWNKFLTPQELQKFFVKNGCQVKLIHGMCYNPVSNNWSWSKSTAINYCIHAIKLD